MEKFNLDRKSFKYFRTLHSMAFLMLGLKNSDVMDDDDYKAASDYLQVKLINPNKSVDELGISLPQDPYLKIIDQAKIKNVSLSNEFMRSGEHIQGGFEKLQQIDKGLGDVPYLGPVYDKIKQYTNPTGIVPLVPDTGATPFTDSMNLGKEEPRSLFAEDSMETSNLGTSIMQNPNMNPAAAASLYEGDLDQALANQVAPRMAAKGGIISLVS